MYNFIKSKLYQNTTHLTNYRADITGLRALAVISVLIFHIFPSYLLGGYLGVDIFFVISGFLITSLLLKEQQEAGKVSLLKFYKRRLLRIAPATIFIVTISIVFANLWLGSLDIKKISLSAIYSTFGFANLYFKNHLATGYFAPDASLTPLLHLWSLGVEEQFYLLLPAMFLLLGKYKRLFFAILFILFVASVFSASIMVVNNQKFAYYMLPTRAFAILLGCLVAMYSFYKPLNLIKKNMTIIIVNVITLLAMACVCGGLWYLKESYNLPSYLSLIVVFPTSIIILLGSHKNIVSRILGSVIFKHIGLWSFSIYLVHWLLLAMYKNIYGINISIQIGLIILTTSIVLGGLQYYLIEQKFRYKTWGIGKILLILIVLPCLIYVASLYRGKILFNKVQDINPRDISSYHGANINFDNIAVITDEPNILLIGDSNAGHYYPALSKITGVKIRRFWDSGCLPLLNPDNKFKPPGEACNTLFENLPNIIKDYDVVIIAQQMWFQTNRQNILEYNLQNILKDKLVLIIGEVVKYNQLDTRYIMQDNIWWFSKNHTVMNPEQTQNILNGNKAMQTIADKHSNVYYVDFNNILCNPNCIYNKGIHSLYFNRDHISEYGSNYIGEKYLERGKIDPVFYKIKKLYKEKKGYLLQFNEKTKSYAIEKIKAK